MENKLTRLPQHIRDELLTAALILPLSSSSVRWAVSPQVAATDASSKGGEEPVPSPPEGLLRSFIDSVKEGVNTVSLTGWIIP